MKEILKFPNLKTLYLHGNKISDLAEIDKLKGLPQLTTLAIHGNPMEKINGFRHYVLVNFPMLKHLNFGGISKVKLMKHNYFDSSSFKKHFLSQLKADKQTAAIWIKSNSKPMKLETSKIK